MSYNEFERSVESINGKIDDHWYVYQEMPETLANMDDMDSAAALYAMKKLRRLCVEGCRLQQFLLEEFEKTCDHGFWDEIPYYCEESMGRDFAMDNDDEVENLRDNVQQRLETLRMVKRVIVDSTNTVYPTPLEEGDIGAKFCTSPKEMLEWCYKALCNNGSMPQVAEQWTARHRRFVKWSCRGSKHRITMISGVNDTPDEDFDSVNDIDLD